MKPIRTLKKDNLSVRIYDSRAAMGEAAAQDAILLLRKLLEEKERVRAIFAAAPSQNEFLSALCKAPAVDWNRITAFHMDEYVALAPDAPQGFGNFLRRALFDRVPFGHVHYIDGNARDLEAECRRYQSLLEEAPIDVVFLGIGENGHIAFNDPPVADFCDAKGVKVVALDPICRNQQVHDGCFASLEHVPAQAITLTVPTLAKAAHHLCIVPAATKAAAVALTINGPIAESCPAAVLRRCRDAVLYLDPDSSAQLTSDQKGGCV